MSTNTISSSYSQFLTILNKEQRDDSWLKYCYLCFLQIVKTSSIFQMSENSMFKVENSIGKKWHSAFFPSFLTLLLPDHFFFIFHFHFRFELAKRKKRQKDLLFNFVKPLKLPSTTTIHEHEWWQSISALQIHTVAAKSYIMKKSLRRFQGY